MNFDFPLILLLLTVFTGVVTIGDLIWERCTVQKRPSGAKLPMLLEYCRDFFPIFLIVLVIRSFVISPYQVPTGSLEPTIIPGDLILCNQFAYGVNFPVWHKRLFEVGKPEHGQIAMFRYPVNEKVNFIKRVIGIPGDKISYINKVFYVNGKKMPQHYVGKMYDQDPSFANNPLQLDIYEETFFGVKHRILVNPDRPAENFYNLVVPKGQYFMIGDNRDNSDDSRSWGFVPERNFIGKGMLVWMSWDKLADWSKKVRFNRIGTQL